MTIDSDQGTSGLRPEIDLAWRRASISGLEPGMEVRESRFCEVEKRSSLSVAAGPVLDKMFSELADTRFSILLTDRSSVIIDRRVNTPSVSRALDRVLAAPGFQYLEEASGTNALATAFELRRPIAVTGDEHYLEALRCFCCYGAPIVHPITHRLEGVLDISGPVEDATTLLGPFLHRAAVDIEERLLEGSRTAEKRLLMAFQSRGNHRHPVLALGESLALTNPAAIDLIKGPDHVALRAIAAELANDSEHRCSLVLASGVEVTVQAQLVAGTRGGAVFEIAENGGAGSNHVRFARGSAQAAAGHETPATVSSRTVLVTGEPGTGRSTIARAITSSPSSIFDSAESLVDEDSWILDVRGALAADLPVVIDDIDVLSSRAARLACCPCPGGQDDGRHDKRLHD